jgi:hypothetical protein
MKKLIYLSLVGALFFSCSKDEDASEGINVAPTSPTLVSPANNKLCVDKAVSFQWNASKDENNDPILYLIEVAKDKDFTKILFTAKSAANYQNFDLEKATAYYWRVKALDIKGLSSIYSATFSLYTTGEGIANYLPFLPDLIAPELNALISPKAAQLKWSAKDVDVKDKLVYDVYFGTTNPPVDRIGSNVEAMSLDVAIVGAKEYFWKVVVKDDKGGATVGQIWRFRTN